MNIREVNYKKTEIYINGLKEDYKRYLKVGSEMLDRVYNEFSNQNLKIEQVENNKLKFELFGLNFVTKPELSLDSETKTIRNGELSTYFIDTENVEQLVFKYDFDRIGNINQRFLENEFSKHYYADFFIQLIEFSVEKEIKLPLIL